MTETTPSLPATSGGTDATRFNALRHGVLSRYTVLPWEDSAEYDALLAALVEEHAPQGPTETHLVEEIAGIIWRKRRLRLAEGAIHRRGLGQALESYRGAVAAALAHLDIGKPIGGAAEAFRASPADTEAALQDIAADEAMTRRAVELLDAARPDAYQMALAALREDTRQWWGDRLAADPADLDEDEEPATADIAGLRRFLENDVFPWFDTRRVELLNRPLIREQALGDAANFDKLDSLGRYEVHLDRKLERMLAMLLRLKDLRPGTIEE